MCVYNFVEFYELPCHSILIIIEIIQSLFPLKFISRGSGWLIIYFLFNADGTIIRSPIVAPLPDDALTSALDITIQGTKITNNQYFKGKLFNWMFFKRKEILELN